MADYFAQPETFERLPFDDHAVVEASAGTGKTYTIERLVAHLLLTEEDLRLSEILVVTFTERATGELRERIRRLLERFLRGPGGLEADEADGPCWEIDGEARKRLEKALFSFDLAPIYTMHGFCRRVLRDHAFANNQPFDLEHVDRDRLFERAFTRALRERFAGEPELVPYLEAWRGQLDRSIEELRANLDSLTRKTGELRCAFEPGRLDELVGELPPPPGEAFVEQFEAELDELHHNRVRALSARLEKLLEAAAAYREHGEMPRLLADIEELDNRNTSSAEYFEMAPFDGPRSSLYRRIFEHAASPKVAVLWAFGPARRETLAEEKREQAVMTFDDMLGYVWEALEGPRGEALAETLREDYRIALIDEFQDTDELQWKIFRRIFYESDDDNRFYLIGDPKQAIYGFRGADVYTYFRARDEVAPERDHPRRVELPDNYRSTPAMIEAYNRIFESDFFTGQNEYPRPVDAGRPEFRAEWSGGEAVVPIQLVEIAPEVDEETGEPVEIGADALRETWAAACAREIADLLQRREALTLRDPGEGVERTLEPNAIQVLTRRRQEGERVARHLRELEVPFAFYKQEGLFETAEARHIYSLLRAVAHPDDRSLRQKAWLTPFFDLELADLFELRDLSAADSPMRELLDWHELAEQRRFGRLVDAILSESGIIRRELFGKESERELTNYLHIFELLVDEARERHADIGELALHLRTLIDGGGEDRADEDIQRLESERNAVQIMTMHKAKGLEADVVFVVPNFKEFGHNASFRVLHDGDERIVHVGDLDPEMERQYARETREAAERLLYVAITRARARAYLPFMRPHGDGYPTKSDPAETFAVALGALTPLVGDGEEVADEHFELRGPVTPIDDAREGREAEPASLEQWSPPEELFEVPIAYDRFAELRGQTPEVLSFSRLAGDHGVERRDLGGEADKIDETEADETRTGGRDEDELPSHLGIGLMLHAILETLDFELVRDHDSLATWRDDPAVDEFIRERMRRHLGDADVERYAGHCKQIVYRTLTTPIRASRPAVAAADGGSLDLGRLVDSPLVDHEAEFFYPTPGAGDADLERLLFDEKADEAFDVEDGYVTGSIDFLFERHGRVYLADWKSNLRPSYAPEHLAAYVEQRYELQMRLYVLAAARALRATDAEAFDARMGGFLFLFVRGIDRRERGATPGVYYRDIDFETVRRFEQELRGRLERMR